MSAQSNFPEINLGFGRGLQINASDSSMTLRISARVQTQFSSERSLEANAPWGAAFNIRRARLRFEGWALSPNLAYMVQLGLAGFDISNGPDEVETGNAPKVIRDALLRWRFHNNFEVMAGQTKLPGNRERVISSSRMQMIDRGTVNGIFTLDRDLGVHLIGKFPLGKMMVNPTFAWAMGDGRNITRNIGGYNYTGRLELLPFGEFTDGGDMFAGDLAREKTPKMMVGFVYNLNQGASRQRQTGHFLRDSSGNYLLHDLRTIYADLMLKYRGFSLHAEYASKKVADIPDKPADADPMPELTDTKGRSYQTGKGFTVQAGYLMKNNLEFVARFSQVTPDYQRAFDAETEYTIGLNKYIAGHNLKLQGDVGLTDQEGADALSLRYRLQVEFGF